MQRVYAEQLVEVKRFLRNANRRNLFIEFQDIVKREILRNLDAPQHFSLVSEIFSRKDRSPDAPIKTERKIALKLYKWSRDRKRKQARPADVHDIAGVTVVCNYPSDTNIIAQILDKEFSSTELYFREVEFKDPVKTRGYQAYHVIACGLGRLNGITCEVQIKTALMMGWGIKTHDLTYKPLGEIDDRLNLYMEKLSNVALILDDQSEILKSLIFDAWEMDEERRNTARHQLISNILTLGDQNTEKVAAFLERHSAELSVSSLSDPLHDKVLSMIDECLQSSGHSKDLCRVVVLYSLCRKLGDRNDLAIEHIDDWYNSMKDEDDQKKSVLSFRSVACMALGEYEEAIQTGREIVKISATLRDNDTKIVAQGNLSYFLSEAYFHRVFDESSGAGELITDASEECRLEALSIAQKLQVQKVSDEVRRLRTLDTKGAVLITCSDQETSIRLGLQLCQEAYEGLRSMPSETAAESFFSLHEKRAFRRLLSFK